MSLQNYFSLSADEVKTGAEKKLKPNWLCLQCKTEDPNKRASMTLFILAGEKYFSDKNYTESIKCFEQAFPLARELKLHLQEGNCYYKIGLINLCHLNQYEVSYTNIVNSKLAYTSKGLFKEYLSNITTISDKYLERNDPNKYGERCLLESFEVLVNNIETIINNKDSNIEDVISSFIMVLEKFFISQHKYDELQQKLEVFITACDSFNDFKGKKILSYKGLILLIIFVKNCSKESSELKDLLEPSFNEYKAYMKEHDITNEKILLNIINLIESFYDLKKIRFYEVLKLMENEYSNGILNNIKGIFLKKFEEFVIQARQNEENYVINESNYSSFFNLENTEMKDSLVRYTNRHNTDRINSSSLFANERHLRSEVIINSSELSKDSKSSRRGDVKRTVTFNNLGCIVTAKVLKIIPLN